MANELTVSYPSGVTLYALVLDAVGRVWSGSSFETPSAANWSEYDVAMPEDSTTGLYSGDMPAVAAGVYGFVVRKQAGGAPATSDITVGASNGFQWDGTTELSLNTIDDYLDTEVAAIVDRLGAFTGTGVNTVLGFLKAMAQKAATLPSDIGGTFSPATDSLEALQENQEGIDTDVWTYATRTLTQAAAAVAAAVQGSQVTITRGDSSSLSLTGLGNISDRSELWFTVKENRSDADAAAKLMLSAGSGLMRVDGAAPTAASGGAITVNNETDGDITVTVAATETDDLAPDRGLFYDVQVLRTSGSVATLTAGIAHIDDDVTRAVS